MFSILHSLKVPVHS